MVSRPTGINRRQTMPDRSPFDYDVSVSAAKRRSKRLRGMSGAVETSTRTCEWPGCGAPGQYRAPASPGRLNEHRWFCLDHVRRYNASWNFFEDVDEDELDRLTRHAGRWERPTWSLGKGPKGPQGMHPHAEGNAWARWGFSDPLEVLGENATINAPAAEAERPRRRLSREEQRAMDTLGVPHQVESRAEVRKAYRELVKSLHPDMNGGDTADARRLERVLRAWELLRKSPNFTD